MARGHDHRNDPEYDRDFYRKMDVEDLTLIVAWMREAERKSFTAIEVSRAATYVTIFGWGIKRIRRVLRVGVEIGWLRACSGHRYEITEDAVATLRPFDVLISQTISQIGLGPGVTRDSVRGKIREQLRRAVEVGAGWRNA